MSVKKHTHAMDVHSRISHNYPSWKISPCLSAVEWINGRSYIHSLEYYAALKTKSCYTMSLMDIMLSQTRQKQKTLPCESIYIQNGQRDLWPESREVFTLVGE